MKRHLLPALAVLILMAPLAFALDPAATQEESGEQPRYSRATPIDDVIRMTKAGVDESAIVAWVEERRNLFVLDADILIALTEAGVSKPVLQAMLDNAYGPSNREHRGAPQESEGQGETRTVYVQPAYDSWYGYPYYSSYYWGYPYYYGGYPYYWGWYGYGYGYGYNYYGRYGHGHGHGHGGHGYGHGGHRGGGNHGGGHRGGGYSGGPRGGGGHPGGGNPGGGRRSGGGGGSTVRRGRG